MNSIIGGASLWTMTAPNRTPERIQGGRRIPEIHRQAGRGCHLGAEHRLRPGHLRRLRTVEAARLLHQERRRRHPGGATRPRHHDPQHQGPAARPPAGNPQYHPGGTGKGAARRPDRAAGDGRRRDARQQGAEGVRQGRRKRRPRWTAAPSSTAACCRCCCCCRSSADAVLLLLAGRRGRLVQPDHPGRLRPGMGLRRPRQFRRSVHRSALPGRDRPHRAVLPRRQRRGDGRRARCWRCSPTARSPGAASTARC